MGEARRRGTIDQRRELGLLVKRQGLARRMGLMDAAQPARIEVTAALRLFMEKLRPGEWERRRAEIIEFLWKADIGTPNSLAQQNSVRVREDEAAWYLFLCQQFLNDPLFNEVSQAQRILPYFAAIGSRSGYAHRIRRLDDKIGDFLWRHYKDPDGVLFEIMVAFAYAEAGWDVEFLEEGVGKTPDIKVEREGKVFHVECKRLSRRTDYAEKERNQFLELWDAGSQTLIKKGQSLWFKGTFHVMPNALPRTFLLDLWTATLPIKHGEQLLIDNESATIWARPVDLNAIHRRLVDSPINMLSGELSVLAGRDWAPENSTVTTLPYIKKAVLDGCPPSVGSYVDELLFICGFTRDFDSLKGNEKKAKDIVKLLSDATNQVTSTIPSIIHIAAETMEGADVERLRTEKIQRRVQDFDFGTGDKRKRIALVRLHRFQTYQRLELAFEADESIDSFPFKGANVASELLSKAPLHVMVPAGTEVHRGIYHWDLYAKSPNASEQDQNSK